MLISERDSQIVDCSFESDGYLLYGTLHLPHVGEPPVVIGSHGLLSTGESPKQIELAHRCTANGIAYFRFDHRGCGRSQGRATEKSSLDGRMRDIVSAARLMLSRPDTGDRLGLFGSSMGGAACIAAFADVEAAALVTFAAPVRSRTVAGLRQPHREPLPADVSGPRPQFDLTDRLNRLHHVLIFHGDDDEVVPPADAAEIYERAQHPKQIIRQAGGDHRMSRPSHQQAFVRNSIDWYKNCFGLA